MPRPLALLFALVTVAWLLGVSAAIASRSPVGVLAALSGALATMGVGFALKKRMGSRR